MKHSIFIIIISLINTVILFRDECVQAAQSKAISNIRIIYENESGSTLINREIPIEKITFDKKINATHPDVNENPKQAEDLWEGVLVRDLLTTKEKNRFKDAIFAIVAIDDFFAQIPLKVILEHDVIFADKRNGKKIPWDKGGIHTVHPTRDPSLPKFYRDFAHPWAWSVAAIVLGKIKSVITVKNGKSTSMLDLAKFKGSKTHKANLNYPMGYRLADAPKGEEQLAYIDVEDFYRSCCDKSGGKSVQFRSYNERTSQIDIADLKNYELVYAWNGKPIPPEFGGAIQLCGKAKGQGCSYYVSEMEVLK